MIMRIQKACQVLTYALKYSIFVAMILFEGDMITKEKLKEIETMPEIVRLRSDWVARHVVAHEDSQEARRWWSLIVEALGEPERMRKAA